MNEIKSTSYFKLLQHISTCFSVHLSSRSCAHSYKAYKKSDNTLSLKTYIQLQSHIKSLRINVNGIIMNRTGTTESKIKSGHFIQIFDRKGRTCTSTARKGSQKVSAHRLKVAVAYIYKGRPQRHCSFFNIFNRLTC